MASKTSAIQIKPVEQLVVELITRYTRPKRIILFGSRARGEAKERADYDFATDDESLTPQKLALLRLEIEELPTLHEIDLVWLNKAGDILRNRILSEGKIIYESKSH